MRFLHANRYPLRSKTLWKQDVSEAGCLSGGLEMAAIRHDADGSWRNYPPHWEKPNEAIFHDRRGGFHDGRRLGFAGPGGAADGDAVTGI